jgi:uncharacterized protein (DUF2062 family)
MSSKRVNGVLSIWAVLGVPLAFALIYNASYKGGAWWSESKQMGTLVFFVLTGAIAMFALPRSKLWMRFLASAAYFVVMYGVLFFVGIGIACTNGNCL